MPSSSTPASPPSTRSWRPCSTGGSTRMPEPDGPDTGFDTDPATADAGAGAGGSAPARRPVIEKHRADKRIIIPKGHARGEEMTRGQGVVYKLTWGLAF